MNAILWTAEFMPYLIGVIRAGGDAIAAIQWGESKVKGWQESGTEPTDADFAELRARRHANDEIINRG